MAEKYNLSVLVIRHNRKAGAVVSKMAGAGTIDMVGAARSQLMIFEDPDAMEGAHGAVMAHTKSNAGPTGVPLRFEIGADGSET